MEALVETTYAKLYSPFAKRHFDRGLAEGERDKILITLELRGLEVTDAQRERITGCEDLAQLKKWTATARTATKTDGLFH
jgi:hypothetical protein